MTTLLKSKNTSIFFSALVAFALMTGQPYSSIASDQPELRDEIVDHIYIPLWMGDPLSLPKGEYKGEAVQYSSEQLGLRDEIVKDVYAPLWMGAPSPLTKGEYKGGPRHYSSEQLELRDELVDHVYMSLEMGGPVL
jgi:hypothetical protein